VSYERDRHGNEVSRALDQVASDWRERITLSA
jgi:hypothetical protein